jgi:glycosyltransferase involved in cell wall biosynthesis
VTLGILYHMPFWQTADGTLWESEGSFARYVDSLAPYFDRVVLCVPVFDRAPDTGSRVRSKNVSLAPLPYFPGPKQFFPLLPSLHGRLRAWVESCDVIHLRVPTPAAIFAFRIARAKNKPIFLLVVGDYAALVPHLGYRGIKKALFGAYVGFEEWALRHMTTRALTFANGAALRAKHEAQGARVIETKTTTLSDDDISTRPDTCTGTEIRLLTVSRIDPRKGLRQVPELVANLVAAGQNVTSTIVGPTIGLIGDSERDAILADAARLGVAERITLPGPIALDRLMSMYREFDIFVLPTRPGEGIPRVLLEAMAAGLPVVTTRVAGITSLITHGENGMLVDDASSGQLTAALQALIESPPMRQRIIANGYATARAHTLERQAAHLMSAVNAAFGLNRSTAA